MVLSKLLTIHTLDDCAAVKKSNNITERWEIYVRRYSERISTVSFLFKNIYITYVDRDKEKCLQEYTSICFHSFDNYVFSLGN